VQQALRLTKASLKQKRLDGNLGDADAGTNDLRSVKRSAKW
jgi:hypothetical protein